MIRTLRPTDVVAYLAFRNLARQNEALEFPGDGPRALTFKSFVSRSLSFDPRRENWIEIQDGHINGVVGVKSRLGTDFWDIDQLAAAPADAECLYISLLRHLSRAALEEGVQKIFLRTALDGVSVAAAKQAGFFQYSVERIFRLPSAQASPKETVSPFNPLRNEDTSGEILPQLRPRRRFDHHAIFQLYCSVVPVSVRQIEGMTMQEWRWTEGWGMQLPNWKVNLPRFRRDFVLENHDVLSSPMSQGGSIHYSRGNVAELSAWLQVKRRTRSLILMLRPEDAAAAADIVKFAMAQFSEVGPIHVPVRDYQAFLEPALRQAGFEFVAEHALLAKTLTIRVAEPKIVPIRAQVTR
ncbi:MAG: hypothetical protein M0T85_06950 [Dehalococcoidales bacterium]|nr:hypothetical protein [Dehalococcoidales bacterium]